MGRLVVASGSGDAVAGWVVTGLGQVLGVPIIHITTRDLATASCWTQRIEPSGAATSTVGFEDGRELSSDEVEVLYNRIVLPPLPPMERIVPHDRDYASAELHACTLSWLATFTGRTINAPHPAALSGDRRTAVEWDALALRVGLPAQPLKSNDPAEGAASRPRQQALVIGDRVVGPPVTHRRASELVALRRRSGLDVIGVDLVETRGLWCVASATAVPDLRRGGRHALAALAELFRPDGSEGRRA